MTKLNKKNAQKMRIMMMVITLMTDSDKSGEDDTVELKTTQKLMTMMMICK